MRDVDCAPSPADDIEVGYLTPREAARYLSISAKHLEHLRRRGGGPRFCKPEGMRLVRYPKHELDAWMESALMRNTGEAPTA